jgi:hypothetical protein
VLGFRAPEFCTNRSSQFANLSHEIGEKRIAGIRLLLMGNAFREVEDLNFVVCVVTTPRAFRVSLFHFRFVFLRENDKRLCGAIRLS